MNWRPALRTFLVGAAHVFAAIGKGATRLSEILHASADLTLHPRLARGDNAFRRMGFDPVARENWLNLKRDTSGTYNRLAEPAVMHPAARPGFPGEKQFDISEVPF